MPPAALLLCGRLGATACGSAPTFWGGALQLLMLGSAVLGQDPRLLMLRSDAAEQGPGVRRNSSGSLSLRHRTAKTADAAALRSNSSGTPSLRPPDGSNDTPLRRERDIRTRLSRSLHEKSLEDIILHCEREIPASICLSQQKTSAACRCLIRYTARNGNN